MAHAGEMLAGDRIPPSAPGGNSPLPTHTRLTKELFLLLPVVGSPTALQPRPELTLAVK